MNLSSSSQYGNSVNFLRRMNQPPIPPKHCDLCRTVIPSQHRHLLNTADLAIVCSCDACALLFEGAIDGRFKLIPRDALALPSFFLSDQQWDNLALPIHLVFLYRDLATKKMKVMYPGAAGATEALLSPQSGQELDLANPILREMEPGVEALLINRIGETREYYLIPIDLCYELVGLIRVHWRGFSGGEKVWQEIDSFFARLRERAEIKQEKELAHA